MNILTLNNLTNDFHQKYLSLLTETKTRIAKTLFQTTAEEVADAETTRLWVRNMKKCVKIIRYPAQFDCKKTRWKKKD